MIFQLSGEKKDRLFLSLIMVGTVFVLLSCCDGALGIYNSLTLASKDILKVLNSANRDILKNLKGDESQLELLLKQYIESPIQDKEYLIQLRDHGIYFAPYYLNQLDYLSTSITH